MDDQGWLAVLPAAELPEGTAVRVELEGVVDVFLYRTPERVYALANHCNHAGGPLHKGLIGRMSGEPTVTCPIHGSLFRLTDGRVLRGPAMRAQPVFDARVHDGQVEIRDRA